MRVIPIACLRDNYAYLLVDEGSGQTAVIDPSEPGPIEKALTAENLHLSAIWLTHHHWDHVGGVEALHDAFAPLEVLGSDYDRERNRIPRQTQGLHDGQRFHFGAQEVQVLSIPGHTLGAIAFLVDGNLFSGDTLFLAGCGRVFEGSMELMARSLDRLRALDPNTRIWCGHEYTLKNLEFALSVERENPIIRDRLRQARQLRAAGRITVPGRIADELETNPFFRYDRPELAGGRSTVASFTALREAKDRF